VLDAQQFVDLVAHVDGDADGASLVGDGARHGLADPPRGVGGEFVAAAVVEFLGGADQADVAFLDQVEERDAASHVFFGDGDDEARVGGNEVFARAPPVLDEAVEFGAAAGGGFALRKFLARQPSAFDALGQFHLFGGGQQRHAADFLEVEADGVVGVDVGEVVVERGVDLHLGLGFLHRHQFVFGGFGGGGVLHEGDAGAQQGRECLLQLLHILLGLGKEMQNVVNRHVGLLTTEFDQTGNGGEFFFFVNDQDFLHIHYAFP